MSKTIDWPRDAVSFRSLRCTSTPLKVDWGRAYSLGYGCWAFKVADVFMAAQASAALGMAQLLVSDRENIVRISPTVSNRFTLDGISEMTSLKGLGDSEARKALPRLRTTFFDTPADDDFQPFYTE